MSAIAQGRATPPAKQAKLSKTHDDAEYSLKDEDPHANHDAEEEEGDDGADYDDEDDENGGAEESEKDEEVSAKTLGEESLFRDYVYDWCKDESAPVLPVYVDAARDIVQAVAGEKGARAVPGNQRHTGHGGVGAESKAKAPHGRRAATFADKRDVCRALHPLLAGPPTMPGALEGCQVVHSNAARRGNASLNAARTVHVKLSGQTHCYDARALRTSMKRNAGFRARFPPEARERVAHLAMLADASPKDLAGEPCSEMSSAPALCGTQAPRCTVPAPTSSASLFARLTGGAPDPNAVGCVLAPASLVALAAQCASKEPGAKEATQLRAALMDLFDSAFDVERARAVAESRASVLDEIAYRRDLAAARSAQRTHLRSIEASALCPMFQIAYADHEERLRRSKTLTLPRADTVMRLLNAEFITRATLAKLTRRHRLQETREPAKKTTTAATYSAATPSRPKETKETARKDKTFATSATSAAAAAADSVVLDQEDGDAVVDALYYAVNAALWTYSTFHASFVVGLVLMPGGASFVQRMRANPSFSRALAALVLLLTEDTAFSVATTFTELARGSAAGFGPWVALARTALTRVSAWLASQEAAPSESLDRSAASLWRRVAGTKAHSME